VPDCAPCPRRARRWALERAGLDVAPLREAGRRLVVRAPDGTTYITTLYKYGAPQIRFNVNDISAFHTTPCPCGNTSRRLQRIFGRNDNMIKLRGVNVFPEAVGAAVLEDKRTNGEFFCFVDRVGEAGVDQMDVWIEVIDESADASDIKQDMERRMKEVLGVKVIVTPVPKGGLDKYTLTSQSSKVKRLMDRRK
jgi:phenylacetate-CoA ligase